MSKWIFLLISLLIIGNSVIYSQDKEFQSFLLESSIENKPGYKTDLPIIDNVNDFVIIKIKIDGNDFNFLYDTGSMISLISENAAGNAERFKKISLTDGSGKNEKVSTVKKDIALNNIVFKDIGFAVIDFEHLNKYSCIQIDGILGANAIRLCNWRINPSDKVLKLSDALFPVDSEALEIELEYVNKLLPLLKINVKNDSFWALLDTGYSNTLIINKDFYLNSKKLKSMPFTSGNGIFSGTYKKLKEQEIKKIDLDSLYINNNLFINVESYITDEKPLLGYGFLKNYISTINMEENKLFLKPLKNSQEKKGSFDISFTMNNKNELIIAYIWDNSQLKEDGVKFGDRITEINGIVTKKVNRNDYCKIKRELESFDEIQISILQNKKVHNYTLQKH